MRQRHINSVGAGVCSIPWSKCDDTYSGVCPGRQPAVFPWMLIISRRPIHAPCRTCQQASNRSLPMQVRFKGVRGLENKSEERGLWVCMCLYVKRQRKERETKRERDKQRETNIKRECVCERKSKCVCVCGIEGIREICMRIYREKDRQLYSILGVSLCVCQVGHYPPKLYPPSFPLLTELFGANLVRPLVKAGENSRRFHTALNHDLVGISLLRHSHLGIILALHRRGHDRCRFCAQESRGELVGSGVEISTNNKAVIARQSPLQFVSDV